MALRTIVAIKNRPIILFRWNRLRNELTVNYFPAAFFAAAAFTEAFDLVGLDLPKLPAKILPFFDRVSPFPITEVFLIFDVRIKKARRQAPCFLRW
jgi:hypothetical protein